MIRRATLFLMAAVAVVLISRSLADLGTGPIDGRAGPAGFGPGAGGDRTLGPADVPAQGARPFATGGSADPADPTSLDPLGLGGGAGAIEPPAAGDGDDPSGRLPVAARIDFWAERVRRDPTDHLSLIQLATLEADVARRSADADGLVRADELLDRVLARVPTSFPAIRAKASVRFALHDFRGADALATRILDTAEADIGALAIQADARLELGDLTAADAGYERLQALAPGPALDARSARLAYLRCDETSAMLLARAARDGAARGDVLDDPAFYAYQLGELARLTGDETTARKAFGAGLAQVPDDVRLLVGLARLNAATGDDDAAIAGLRRATAIVPAPDALALLGELLEARGDMAGAQAAFQTIEAMDRLSGAQASVVDRQLAAVAIERGDADAALVSSLRAALDDRPDAYGHDLLAWALHATGDDEAAAQQVELALASGTCDARILYHAGAIDVARGSISRGEERLRSALDRSTALSPAELAEIDRLVGQPTP